MPTIRCLFLNAFMRRVGVPLLLALFLGPIAGVGVGEETVQDSKQVVGDRLFLWGHSAGVYNSTYTKNFKPSKIEPVDATDTMGLRNMYFIRCDNNPPLPFTEYYAPFKKLNQVLWSLTGAAGVTSQEEREAAFQLAAANRNLTGFIMDDFFHGDATTADVDLPMPASLSPEELRNLRGRLVIDDRRLRLSVVVYTTQISSRAKHHLQYVDEITLWTWQPKDLMHLEENLAKLESIAPEKNVVLGCYIFDFSGNAAPLAVEQMKHQVELGYRWLQQGRIQGMIFLASPICDLDLEAVDFTRKWIAEVKDLPLQGKVNAK
jgi:hypothetical protein